MAAIVGDVLDAAFTEPTIAEMAVSEHENIVLSQQEGAARFKGIQSLDDLRNNWNLLPDTADLTDEERREAVRLFNEKVETVPGTEV
jgi:hypothetical protein